MAWVKPKIGPDDYKMRQRPLPDCVAELAWYVKARGYDDTLACWASFRRGEDEWVVKDWLRNRFLVDWEWCYLAEGVEPDRLTAETVLNLIPPLLLGEARNRWTNRGSDPDLLYVVAGHVDGPEVDC